NSSSPNGWPQSPGKPARPSRSITARVTTTAIFSLPASWTNNWRFWLGILKDRSARRAASAWERQAVCQPGSRVAGRVCRTRRKSMKFPIALLLLSVLLLAACGQKGPLYLPADEPAQPAATTTATQADPDPATDA